jgi:drug/metabolite transporter (DMT)-like permease
MVSPGVSTGLGFLAILIWSTSIAVGRLVVADIGVLMGPFILTLASGAVGLLALLLRRGSLALLATLPRRYWIVCGGLFVLYMACYNLGIGLAADRRQVLAFAVLNYLWPVLTLVFSALFSRARVSPWLAAGVALAVAGIVLALLARQGAAGGGLPPAGFVDGIRANPAVYALGLACGVSWALYSALSRRLAAGSPANPVPLLFLCTAAVFGVLLAAGAGRALGKPSPDPRTWSGLALAALAWRALVADLVAYACWDAAMRRGNQILAAAASFFTPLLATACIALVLGVAPGWQFWAACGLLVAGAAVSRVSVRESGS